MIKFGTDGWRGIIAEDFTTSNVRTVAGAAAHYALEKNEGKRPLMIIGYDTRFNSEYFAQIAAEVLSISGCDVVIADSCVSTPALSSSVVGNKAFGGIMISASHNPPEFNGMKYKTFDGCSAPDKVTKRLEELTAAPGIKAAAPGKIEKKALARDYLKRVASMVNMRAIASKSIKVVADPMYGSGAGYIKSLLKHTKVNLTEIHTEHDPLFGGLHPEPIDVNLEGLKNEVKRSGAAAGLAVDGDADRIGVVDEKGRYLTPHQVFPLLLYYLCRYKARKGKVVQAISLGYLSERIAGDYGLKFEEVPVGFKYIAQKILDENILIGGEESGGYGYGDYLPERDGVLNSMFIIEMLAETGKTLSGLLAEMQRKYGSSAYLRTDFRNPGISKQEFVERLKAIAPDKISGLKVREIKDYDGIEFVLEDDSWLLLRPSGTEPLIRVYSEAENVEKTIKIIAWGKKAVSRLSS